MTDNKLSLDDIFSQLPDVVAPASKGMTADAKTQHAFSEISAFVSTHGREPMDAIDSSFEERSLARKLKRIRDTPSMMSTLAQHDVFNLLKQDSREGVASPPSVPPIISATYDIPTSIDEILGSLDDDNDGIFTLRNVRSHGQRIEQADFTSQREKCPIFERYDPLFKQVSKELSSGMRQPVQFRREQEIFQGQFFILNGLLLYIADVGPEFEKNGKKNRRLKVIFSNGTQGNNLLRSIATELYKDPNGRRITDPRAGGMFGNSASDNDISTGTVYVLQSLSSHAAVAPNRNILHKIGVTTGSVQTRVANAEKESTYLLAPVKVVAEFGIFNTKPQGIEKLLHTYFDAARAEITIEDRFGNPVKSREWFFVSVPTIKEAVDRLTSGTLAQTYYDLKTAQIVLRGGASD